MTRKDTRTPDQLFAAFRGDDDIEALAELFDRIAPTLLRIADRLARDRSSAEDLLQSTFLAAIADREQFDSTRALTPWLIGILVNRARQVWRQTHAEEHEPLPAEVVGPRETPSPGELLELDEFQEALLGAISELPHSVRSAVAGRLLDEESHAQLSARLGISRENLRVRLHRGLAMLRTRLRPSYGPLAFIPPLAGLNTRLRLRPLRRTILDSAHKKLGLGASSAVAASGLLTSSGMLLLAGAAVLGVSSLALALHSNLPSSEDLPPPDKAALYSSLERTGPARDALEVAESESGARTAVATPAGLDSELAVPMGALQIQVLCDVDRMPLSGARLCLRSELLDDSIAPTIYTADSSGFATIPMEAGVLEDSVTLLATDTTVPALARLRGRLRVGQVKPLTIEAFKGKELRIQVVGRDLLPVNGATVELTFRNKSLEGSDRTALTGANGYALLTHVGQPISIRAHKDGMVSVNELRGRLKADGQERIEPLVLAPQTLQSGRVLDTHGQPIDGADITMKLDNELSSLNIIRGSVLRSFPKAWDLSTEADGTFLVPDMPRAPLTIEIHKQGLRTWNSRIESPGGELAVTLQPYPRFPGKVTDEDAAPIHGALVQLVVQRDGNSQVVGEANTDIEGLFDLAVTEDLPLNQLDIFLRVAHADFLTATWRILDVDQRADDPLNVTLQRGANFTGQVTEEDGTPVAGALITLNADYEANWRMIPAQDQDASLLDRAAHTYADNTGHFNMSNTPVGPLRVLVHRQNMLRPSLVAQLDAGTTEADFVLPPFQAERASLKGKISDANTGKTLLNGHIEIDYIFGSGTERPASYPLPAATLDTAVAQGEFHFSGLQAGLLHISASAPGYETPHFLPLDLEPGQHEFQILLAPLRTATVDLSLPDGISPDMLRVAITRHAKRVEGRLPRKNQAYRTPRWSSWTQDETTGSYRIIISRIPASLVTLTVETDHVLLEELLDLSGESSGPLQFKIEE